VPACNTAGMSAVDPERAGMGSGLMLSAVALAGAIFAWVVIGRRRTPDHIEMTHAAAV
jgi:hypothetical protein